MDEPIDELSIYLLPGRVSDPARALTEAREAERLGFGRVWLAERPDLKEAAVVCGAVAASTERIGVGTGLVIDAVRHPLMTAAFGATMQAMFGDRFTLGLTRGVKSWVNGLGLRGSTPAEFERYVATLRGLWAGEKVPHRGENGECHLEFVDKLREAPPKLLWGTFGNTRGVEIAARSFDAVALIPFFTVEAVAETVRRVRAAVERNGRDPAAFRIVHCMVTAPDLTEDEELAIVNARAVTYFQMPGYGDAVVAKNGWDPGVVEDLRNHPVLAGSRGGVADLQFTRAQLVEVGRSLPEEWMRSGAALGSAKDCCDRMREYFDAGVDEIWIHGTSPSQNAGLAELWRNEYRTRRNAC